METLTELTRQLLDLRAEVSQENQRHEVEIKRLNVAIQSTSEVLNRHRRCLDNDKVQAGMAVLSISGSYTNSGGEVYSARYAAIADLATNGGKGMADTTFGVKDFDRFIGQRCDCSYGCGPRHGYITFSVGLAREFRGENVGRVTAEQIEAALYVLHNLVAIEDAREEAKLATA